MGTYDRKEAVELSRSWVRIGSVILITSGTLSTVVPLIAGQSMSIIWGLSVLTVGLAYGILTFSVRERGASLWLAPVSVAFLVVAMSLLAKQNTAVANMPLAIAASVFIESAGEIAYFAIAGARTGSEWALLNAILTLLLTFLIWWGWPRSSTWVLGIVGGHLIASGLTWILRSRATY